MENTITMKSTIIDIPKDKCTGCAACANICPVGAIQMEYDDEGFIYPMIIETKCIHCGNCYSICPAINYQFQNNEEPACYAIWAEDKIRKVSSSGGVFTVLAEEVLKQGGIVYGAAFTEDYLKVKHISAESAEELEKLRQSKYVQSEIGENFYTGVKKQLDAGRLVLFVGCPCQVAGLQSFLKNEYEKLLTCDLVCHGANSVLAYQMFLNEKSKGKEIESVSFRDKSVYPWSTLTYIRYKDGTNYLQTGDTCTWYKGFLRGITVRDSCVKCMYARCPRAGDLTLGDWWHVQKIDKTLNDGKGTSQVLVNTVKGEKFLQQVKDRFTLLEKTPLEFAKKANPSLKEPLKEHPFRSLFYRYMKRGGFDQAIEKTIKKKFDLGVVGWWYNDNYGGVLTCYSLYSVLCSLGYTVLMIDIPTITVDRKQEKIDTMSRRFGRKHYLPLTTVSSMEDLNDYCDMFVSGTDQMWNYNQRQRSTGRYDYYLAFANDSKNTITYATSYGDKLSCNDAEYMSKAKRYAQRIKHISVREDYCIEGLRKIYNVESAQVLDPIFLSSVEVYKNIAAASCYNLKKTNYVLSFILNPSEEKIRVSRYIAAKLNYTLITISDPEPLNKRRIRAMLGDCSEWKEDIELEDFVALMINADFIFTDSYHGTCLSMLLRKNFISLANKERGAGRFISLYRTFNVKNTLIKTVDEVYEKEILFNKKDYNEFETVLYKRRTESLAWLVNALNNSLMVNAIDTKALKDDMEKIISNLQEIIKKF